MKGKFKNILWLGGTASVATVGAVATVIVYENKNNNALNNYASSQDDTGDIIVTTPKKNIYYATKYVLDNDGNFELNNVNDPNSFKLIKQEILFDGEELVFANDKTLKSLVIEYTYLSSLTISNCPNLVTVFAGNNQLVEFNINNCKNIHEIDLNHNELSQFSFQSYSLELLHLDFNNLTSLNVANLPMLKVLWAGSNQISSFNLGMTMLELLHIDSNNLEELDLSYSGNALKELYYDNKTNVIWPSNWLLPQYANNNVKIMTNDGNTEWLVPYASINNPDFTNVIVYDLFVTDGSVIRNKLEGTKNLVINNIFADVEKIVIIDGEINTVQISNCVGLKSIFSNNNKITNVFVSNCPRLEEIDFDHNNISNLVLKNTNNLKLLHVDYNQLTSIDLTNLPNLEVLWAGTNNLLNLDLTYSTELKLLHVDSNNLANLDLSKCSKLSEIYFDNKTNVIWPNVWENENVKIMVNDGNNEWLVPFDTLSNVKLGTNLK